MTNQIYVILLYTFNETFYGLSTESNRQAKLQNQIKKLFCILHQTTVYVCIYVHVAEISKLHLPQDYGFLYLSCNTMCIQDM